MLERCKKLGDYLVVGISSDELNYSKKTRYPIHSFEERKCIIKSLSVVDAVFKEESLEKKIEYIKEYNADVFAIGDDWLGKFDNLIPHCEVVYLERTPCISTTETIEKIIISNK